MKFKQGREKDTLARLNFDNDDVYNEMVGILKLSGVRNDKIREVYKKRDLEING